jgi:hypothetical protein
MTQFFTYHQISVVSQLETAISRYTHLLHELQNEYCFANNLANKLNVEDDPILMCHKQQIENSLEEVRCVVHSLRERLKHETCVLLN